MKKNANAKLKNLGALAARQLRHADLEHEQRHRDCENRVAEVGDPVELDSGAALVAAPA